MNSDFTSPKVIFHDIDGCLNPPNGETFGSADVELSVDQRRVLVELKGVLESKGIQLILNTGRNLEDSMGMVEVLSGPSCRYGLFEHGAYGWDFEANHELRLDELAAEQGDQELAEKYSCMAVIPDLIEWYRLEGRRLLGERLGVEPLPLRKRSNLSLECLGGITAPVMMEALKEVVEEGFANPSSYPLVYCHSEFFVDVLGTIHKSDGARVMARYLGVSNKELLVVGDGMNDMDMFEAWPGLLCPDNAVESLKALCRERGGVVSRHSYIGATIGFLKTGCQNQSLVTLY